MNALGLIVCLDNSSRNKNMKILTGARMFLTLCRSHLSKPKPSLSGAQKRPLHYYKRTFCLKSKLIERNLTVVGINHIPGFHRETWTVSYSTSGLAGKHTSASHLTKEQMQDLVLHLTAEERTDLQTALHEFQSKKAIAEYEGQLAGTKWRSTFGRPSKLPTLGDVDPTGTYCTVPEDWLARKYAETVPLPNTSELTTVIVHNAIPFVGFGFLDNFCMIVAGDYIELTIGSMMVLSTMAAAALGNTISDIMGIGSAWYVERLAIRVGIKAPQLTPIQLDMPVSRRAANLGRVVGVTMGCLLGMLPLIFIGKKKKGAAVVTPEATDIAAAVSDSPEATDIAAAGSDD